MPALNIILNWFCFYKILTGVLTTMFSRYLSLLKSEFNGYNKDKLVKDLIAGITVSAVSLPLSLAFAISSGANAASGLITAIFAGFIIGMLSGASFQISGPTGTMTAIMLTLVASYGLQGIFIAGFIAGIVLLLAGIFKLGGLVSFIPLPVITGFTSGIAIIIFSGQIDNIAGLKSTGTTVIAKLLSYFTTPQNIDIVPLILGLSVILFMILYPKSLRKYLPDPLMAIILATAVNIIFKLPVKIVGEIPRGVLLPDRLNLLAIDTSHLPTFISAGISIAALIMIETLLCGKSASRMKNEKIDSNQELVAQGIGNMIIALLGGVPATAALARSSVAIKAGGQTRLTNIFHSLVLLLSMFLLSPVLSQIPLAALSGVLIVTAIRMNDWAVIKDIFSRKIMTAIFQFLITMVVTFAVDLTTAVLAGIGFSVLMFMIKISDMQVSISDVKRDKISDKISDKDIYCDKWDRTDVIYITGPLFFGTASILEDKLPSKTSKEILIFSMRGVTMADVSGVQALMELCNKLHNIDTKLYFSCVQNNVMEMFKRCGMVEIVGEDAFFWSTDKALDYIRGQNFNELSM
jgi:SulP family sulfate permease